MREPRLPIGAFVWCRFPLQEAPREPGPEDHLHLVYVADVTTSKVLTIYTTSVLWDPAVPTPIGVIIVKAQQAAALGQKPFVLDARRIALLPVTTEWFPDLESKNHGVLMVADKVFQKEVTRVAHELAKRSSNMQFYGPDAKSDIDSWKPER